MKSFYGLKQGFRTLYILPVWSLFFTKGPYKGPYKSLFLDLKNEWEPCRQMEMKRDVDFFRHIFNAWSCCLRLFDSMLPEAHFDSDNTQ